jgi:hypothetical protein
MRGFELYKLSEAHHDVECTDNRAKLFDLVSLATFTEITSTITVNYSSSVKEIYIETMTYMNHRFWTSARKSLDSAQLRKYASFR